MQIGAQHFDVPQVGEDVGIGVAIVVAGPGGHHRQPRADRIEEARQVRVAPVVGHLEHERAQALRVPQQRALRLGLRVSGE